MAEIIKFPNIKKPVEVQLLCTQCGFDAFYLSRVRGLLVSDCVQCDAEIIITN